MRWTAGDKARLAMVLELLKECDITSNHERKTTFFCEAAELMIKMFTAPLMLMDKR